MIPITFRLKEEGSNARSTQTSVGVVKYLWYWQLLGGIPCVSPRTVEKEAFEQLQIDRVSYFNVYIDLSIIYLQVQYVAID